MAPKRAFLIQTLLEALIPVIGYFEWNWDLSFILLFYLLDWLLAIGITIAKGIKRLNYSADQQEKRLLLQFMGISILLLAAACGVIATAIVQLQPEMSWKQRVWEFLVYKDMGIEQGVILVPLLLLNGIMTYRQQFLMTARYRTQTMSEITRPLVWQGILLLACGGTLLGIAQFVHIPQLGLIIVAVLGISVYRWLVIRKNQ